MLQASRELDLPQEPLRPECHAELRMQHLERHAPVVLQIVRQVDGGHSPSAELALEEVAVGQG